MKSTPAGCGQQKEKAKHANDLADWMWCDSSGVRNVHSIDQFIGAFKVTKKLSPQTAAHESFPEFKVQYSSPFKATHSAHSTPHASHNL